MLKLYHNDMSVCAQKVRLALAELELEWENHHMTLRGNAQFDPEFLKISPKGLVPVLIDGDHAFNESTIINEYLADTYGAGELLPATPVERARMRWWTRQLDEDIHRATSVVSISVAFIHQFRTAPPKAVSEHLKQTPEEQLRDLKRLALDTGLDNPELPWSMRRMNKLFGDMETQLKKTEWLTGDTISLADVGFTSYTLRFKHLRQDALFANRPKLAEWFERMQARPSYKVAIGDWLNDDYLNLKNKTGSEAAPRLTEMLSETY